MSRINLKAQNRIFKPLRFTKLFAFILVFLCIMSCATAQADYPRYDFAYYIDESGRRSTPYEHEQYPSVEILRGRETTIDDSWYYASNDLSYPNGLKFTGRGLCARIILADGATITIGSKENPVLCGIDGGDDAGNHINIYGQEKQTGTINIYSKGVGIDIHDISISGGNLSIDVQAGGYGNAYGIFANHTFEMRSGDVHINVSNGGHDEYAVYAGSSGWITYAGTIEISGGRFEASGDLKAGYTRSSGLLAGKIHLGLKKDFDGTNGGQPSEYITATGYYAGGVWIIGNQTLSDGTNLYTGTRLGDDHSGILSQKQVDELNTPDADGKAKLLYRSKNVDYIDEDGIERGVGATPITQVTDNMLTDGWYIVNEDKTFSDTLTIAKDATVNIILANGKTLTLNPATDKGIQTNGRELGWLNIYGQDLQTGKLNITTTNGVGIDVTGFTQNGGNVSIDTGGTSGIWAASRVNINNGSLNIKKATPSSLNLYSIYTGGYAREGFYRGEININGGKVSTDKGFYAGPAFIEKQPIGIITLGFTSKDNYIRAGSYNAQIVQVADGQVLKISDDKSAEEARLLSGIITASKDQIKNVALVPNDIRAISYNYGLNDGESLLSEGYMMVISLDNDVDGLSMYIDNKSKELLPADNRKYLTFLSSSDLSASTFTLKATNSSATSFIFVSENPADDLMPGTHDIALNSSATKGEYIIAGIDAGALNPRAYSPKALPLSLDNPARRGYTFTGWTGSNGSTAQKDYSIPKGTTGNLSYRANWTLDSYDITYNLDGGTKSEDPVKYSVITDTFTITAPKKTGYTFLGWTGTGLDGATQSVRIAIGSTGNREYTAHWAKSFTPSGDKPEFVQHSMLLKGQIVVMFYVYFPEGYTPDKCYMSFDVSGDISENPIHCVYTESVNVNGYTLYGYPCYVNSVQMADEIHAQIYSGDIASTRETYSAKTYFDRVEASSDVFPSETLNLCKAIKDYGHYVQIPLSKENKWEIGKKHAAIEYAHEYDNDYVLLAKQGAADYALSKDTYAPTFTYVLYLDSVTTLEVSFDSSVTNLACDGVVVTGNVVTISDISAHELGKFRKITGTKDSKEFTVNISPLSYVNSVLKDTTEVVEGITNSVTSLYHYYDRTMRYRDKH